VVILVIGGDAMDVRGMRDKGVVITGASRGLGAALAFELGKSGARLALVARGDEELAKVVRAIREEGGDAHALAFDVSAKEDAYAIAGSAGAAIGDVDVVIHNASMLAGDALGLALLADTPCEDLEAVFGANLVGPFRLTKALIGPMILRARGLVVHVTSDAAVNAYPRWGAYAASKAALDHMARTWAAELEGTGVRFFGVDPSDMDTAMHARAVPDADRSKLARPREVARVIAEMIGDDRVANGARLEVSSWRPR
jgi:NAD(P)-dependent dehydrogenase (short-subunit alcohol dehydrogenase family)